MFLWEHHQFDNHSHVDNQGKEKTGSPEKLDEFRVIKTSFFDKEKDYKEDC